MESILEDIRVVDLTHVWFGPWTTMMLAEMGAKVIKVEPPWGALGRIEEYGPMYGGAAPSFHHLNLNKKGMVINLKHEEGLKLIKALIAKSDVIINNFAPGTMEKLGLSYEDCRAVKPDIIYAVLSGFGDTGPYREYSSYAPIAEAAAGYARQMGDSIDPEGPPKGLVGFFGDLAPGTMAAMAIIGAIRFRDKTGKGQKIDCAQFDTMFAYNTGITNFFVSGKDEVERRKESEERRKQREKDQPQNPLQSIRGYIKVRDGYVMIGGMRPKAIEALKETLGVDEEGLTKELVEEFIKEKTKVEAFNFFARCGMPCAPVYYGSESAEDPHIIARDMIVEVDHPLLGRTRAINFGVKMSESPGRVTSAAPLLGQHQREIITKLLGYGEEEFDHLVKEGVIAYQPDLDKKLVNWKSQPPSFACRSEPWGTGLNR
ncbi:MAG TPA: CoA transferase [Patescibacteria group bacterium]|nr:CoA transferase [Patescibacteria group bacterium]